MPQSISPTELSVPLKIKVERAGLTSEQFFLLCQENRELRFELTAQQELVILPLVGGMTGIYNARLTHHLADWTQSDGTGIAFASSAGFTLPNGAVRSPDASWIRQEKWRLLTKEQRERFAPICPDFVVELRSPTDRLSELQEKMQEYIANGSRLGWLIDLSDKYVYIYRPGRLVEVLDNPTILVGDPVLPGFALRVAELW